MIGFLLSLSTALLGPEEYRYLRPEGGKFVVESEVKLIENQTGPHYTSKTFRGKQTLTLTIQRDRESHPLTAELSNDVSLLEQSSINVDDMRKRIAETGVGQVVLILDACRNDPSALPRAFRG